MHGGILDSVKYGFVFLSKFRGPEVGRSAVGGAWGCTSPQSSEEPPCGPGALTLEGAALDEFGL
jgi:hypothetical protein